MVVAKIGFAPWLRCALDKRCCNFKSWLRWVQIEATLQLQTEVAMAASDRRQWCLQISGDGGSLIGKGGGLIGEASVPLI